MGLYLFLMIIISSGFKNDIPLTFPRISILRILSGLSKSTLLLNNFACSNSNIVDDPYTWSAVEFTLLEGWFAGQVFTKKIITRETVEQPDYTFDWANVNNEVRLQ